jgi:SSS family solute:Na+ symporter
MEESVVSTLATVDQIIIAIYLIGVFILGSYFARYVGNSEDFFLAGRALPFWAIGMSVVVSDIGATDFIATSGAGYTYGISAANFDWLGSMPAMVFAAFIFIPYYWRSGVFTIPEFLGRRYNTAVQMIHATIWGIFLLTMLAVMLFLTAQLLETVLGWNLYASIWLIAFITGIYTFSGGLSAVVMTDVIQMFVMFVGGFALLALGLYEVGGWEGLQSTITSMPGREDHFRLLLPHDSKTPYPWTGIVFGLGIVMATGYMAGNQAVVQRCMGARSEWDAKAGMLLAGFIKVFIPAIIIIPGLCAVVLFPSLKNGDMAVPSMIRDYLPPGLRGLMFSALFAALMSSVDSYLNSATTIWTTDLYGRAHRWLRGSEVPTRQALLIGRFFTLAFIIGAALLAPQLAGHDTMYNFIQTSLSMFQGPVFAILLVGILWHRATQWGGLAGLLLGVTFTTILHNTEGVFPSDDPFLFVAWWSFIFSVTVTVIVSLLTPPEPEDKIRGLVFGQVLKDGQIQRVLRERAEG